VNPVDLGYAAAEIAVALANGSLGTAPGGLATAGRLGQIKLGEGNVATLQPFVVNEGNIARFADIY
jgi:rhamnose transport system substrate-binding protein